MDGTAAGGRRVLFKLAVNERGGVWPVFTNTNGTTVIRRVSSEGAVLAVWRPTFGRIDGATCPGRVVLQDAIIDTRVPLAGDAPAPRRGGVSGDNGMGNDHISAIRHECSSPLNR